MLADYVPTSSDSQGEPLSLRLSYCLLSGLRINIVLLIPHFVLMWRSRHNSHVLWLYPYHIPYLDQVLQGAYIVQVTKPDDTYRLSDGDGAHGLSELFLTIVEWQTWSV